MKDNFNIDELFKEKFSDFEGNVDPSAWANISQGIGAGASGGAAGAGLSGLAKVAIITGAIAVTSVTVWYFNQDDEIQPNSEEFVVNEETVDLDENTFSVNEVIAEDTSDPVLQENEQEIQDGRGNLQLPADKFDQETIDLVLSNENTGQNSNSGNNNSQSGSNSNGSQSNGGQTNGNSNGSQSNNDAGQDANDNAGNNGSNEVKIVKPDVAPETVMVDAELKVSKNGKLVDFDSKAKNHDNVYWEFGDGTTAEGNIVTHEYERPGTYTVEMTVTGEGSALVDRVDVEIEGTSSVQAQKDISNIITPNGDRRNDFFSVKSNDIETFTVVIYDMAGRKVYSSENPDFEWNGEKYDGSVEKGNYIYKVVAEGSDGAIFKRAGTVQVIF